MSLRARSAATSLRTRVATALALVMLVPVAAGAIAIGVVVPAQARSRALASAQHDAGSAALALATRCQVVADAATGFARQVAQYAAGSPALTPALSKLTTDSAVAGRPGLSAGVLDLSGHLLAFSGDPSGRTPVWADAYGAACTHGSAGSRPDLFALAESRPVRIRQDGKNVQVATVVLWQTIDDGVLRVLARSIGSSATLTAIWPAPTGDGVKDGVAQAIRPSMEGMPFALQARQPVSEAGLGPLLAGLAVIAVLLAVLITWTIAGRLVDPLRRLTGTADRLRSGDPGARSDVQRIQRQARRDDEVTRLAGILDELAGQLQHTVVQLQAKTAEHAEAARLSITDPLTGVGNVRHLSNRLSEEVGRAIRFDRPLTVLMLDLDHFKQVNDTLGHQFGDAVLRDVAHRVRGVLREVDIVARYGGEEFAIVLPETDVDGGSRAAERVIEAVRARPFGTGDAERTVTVSVGVAAFPQHAQTAANLLRAADQALYAAKEGGRDRWIVASVSADSAESVPQAG